jgi:hypothetical protein
LGKLHLDERLARILDGCPARTDLTLWTGDRFRFPIDAEVGEVIASLRLIPVRLEGGANQIHSIAGLRLFEIGRCDISRIDEMLLWEQFLFSQVGMKSRDNALIADGGLRGLDMSDQLGGIFITTLS